MLNHITPKNPLITIITVCYNAENVIRQTIDSILSQSYKEIEYIIVDGKSTDKTMCIIEELQPLLIKEGFQLSISSEPDKGIYDAMNKGIRRSHGEWINFMNAGDNFYNPEILSKIFLADSNLQSSEIIYGDTVMKMTFGNIALKPKSLDNLDKRMAFCHQSVFVRSRLLREHPFNTSYKIAADYEMFYFFYKQEYKFLYLPIIISAFEAEYGASSNRLLLTKECSAINGTNKRWYYPFNFLFKRIVLTCKGTFYALLPNSILKEIRKRNYKRLSRRRLC